MPVNILNSQIVMMQITSVAVILLTILLGVASSPAFSAVKNLPEDVRTSLKDESAFLIRATVSSIPNSVLVSFARELSEDPFAMAEPDAEWQATDVILKPGLPRRRLGKVALAQSFCILFYELGGRGHSHHVVVFRLFHDGARLIWRAVLDRAVTDPAALLMAIDEGKVDDDPRSGF